MQRLFSRFADLPMAAKLALLSGVAVLASLLIAYGGRTGLADLKSASDTEVELSRARASLHHLDTRNSELKVDAYRALSDDPERSEEHTSELQSLMRISYAVFCL